MTPNPISSADIILLGRTITQDTYRVFATTTAYMQNDRTWCVSLAKPIPVWLNLWMIASEPIWCLALVTVYLEGFVVFLLMRYEHGHAGFMKKDFHYCLLMMAASSFTGMPHMTYRPKSKHLGFFICVMLMTGILISIAWNCFLIKVLTQPKFTEQISTISGIIEKDFRLIGLHNGKDLMLMQPTKVITVSGARTPIPIYFSLIFQYPKDKEYHGYADIDSCLEQLKWDDKLAVSISRLRAENCALIRKSEMYCFSMRENIYTYSQSLRTTKKYEFLPQIDIFIRRCSEAGLFQKWNRESSMYRNDPVHKFDRRIILSIAHIGAALLALVCGLCIGLLVLMAECVAFRKTKQPNCRRFWFFLSRIVDGRRFYFRAKTLKRKVLFVKKKYPARSSS